MMYTVQQIIDKKLDPKSNKQLYLVKWQGYDITYASWQPYEHLEENCADLVQEFQQEYGQYRTTTIGKIVITSGNSRKNYNHNSKSNNGNSNGKTNSNVSVEKKQDKGVDVLDMGIQKMEGKSINTIKIKKKQKNSRNGTHISQLPQIKQQKYESDIPVQFSRKPIKIKSNIILHQRQSIPIDLIQKQQLNQTPNKNPNHISNSNNKIETDNNNEQISSLHSTPNSNPNPNPNPKSKINSYSYSDIKDRQLIQLPFSFIKNAAKNNINKRQNTSNRKNNNGYNNKRKRQQQSIENSQQQNQCQTQKQKQKNNLPQNNNIINNDCPDWSQKNKSQILHRRESIDKWSLLNKSKFNIVNPINQTLNNNTNMCNNNNSSNKKQEFTILPLQQQQQSTPSQYSKKQQSQKNINPNPSIKPFTPIIISKASWYPSPTPKKVQQPPLIHNSKDKKILEQFQLEKSIADVNTIINMANNISINGSNNGNNNGSIKKVQNHNKSNSINSSQKQEVNSIVNSNKSVRNQLPEQQNKKISKTTKQNNKKNPINLDNINNINNNNLIYENTDYNDNNNIYNDNNNDQSKNNTIDIIGMRAVKNNNNTNTNNTNNKNNNNYQFFINYQGIKCWKSHQFVIQNYSKQLCRFYQKFISLI